MEAAFVLWHVRNEDDFAEDAKLIGVYRSRQDADNATLRLSNQPGFRDYPNGFQISAYEVGKDHWTEGFVDLG